MVRRLSSDDTNSGPRAEQLSERLFWGRLLIGWVAALEEPDAVLGRQLASIDTDAGLQLGQDLETMVPLPPATHSPLPPIHHCHPFTILLAQYLKVCSGRFTAFQSIWKIGSCLL